MHDIYSNVDVTWRIHVKIWKIFIWQQMTIILKVHIKSPKNNYKQRVKSLFEQVWCAKLRFINWFVDWDFIAWDQQKNCIKHKLYKRLSRDNCPTVFYKRVLIKFIFENNLSTYATLKGSINNNFNKYMNTGWRSSQSW